MFRRTNPAGMAAASTTTTAARPRASGRHGIRWDRLGRIALLAVLALVVYLYIGPTKAWIAAYREAEVRRTEVAALKERNDELRARKAALRRDRTLEQEARELGMVRAGEKAFVVRGLPDG